MRNRKAKTMTRVVAGILAVLLMTTALIGSLNLFVSAAEDAGIPRRDMDVLTLKRGGTDASSLQSGKYYNFTFQYTQTVPAGTGIGDLLSNSSSGFTLNSNYAFRSNSSVQGTKATITLRITSIDVDSNLATFEGEVKNACCANPAKESVELTIMKDTTNLPSSGGTPAGKYEGAVLTDSLSALLDNGSGNNGSGDYNESATYTSNILIENAVALDSSGRRIDKVTKDTPSFTVEVTFADIGLQRADYEDLKNGEHSAYFTGGSFEMSGAARGTLQYLGNRSTDYPRFRATFKNVTYTGAGKEFTFRALYYFDEVEETVQGEATARVYAAQGEDGGEDSKMGMPVPKIIISNYSYGEETIIAGDEFNLDFTVTNTSKLLPLENIVITMTPISNESQTKGPGLIVASSSNTIYLPALAAGASQNFSVAFQARPDAEVTSHLVQIAFSYEYVDTNLKSREKVPDLSESIAIPVSQVDRFEVLPITASVYGVPGEETYLTVNFVNKGKSTTNNVSGSVKIDPSISAPSQHYGHLEAGKSDYLDLYLTPSQPGEFNGEVVIQYEDENSNMKEITTPFSIYVEDPAAWYPPQDEEIPPPDMDMEQSQETGNMFRIVMCVIGGIAIAAPIALYLMKRVRAKGSEDFDEDF